MLKRTKIIILACLLCSSYLGYKALKVYNYYQNQAQLALFTTEFVQALAPELQPGEHQLIFKSSSPFSRHNNYIVFHFTPEQEELYKQRKLAVKSGINTEMGLDYGIFSSLMVVLITGGGIILTTIYSSKFQHAMSLISIFICLYSMKKRQTR
ncbi:hypothetical protein L0B53_04290 [Vibrio sp. SS-MA-C1-2]|uniref:hypothetical protein n=1 Tax=Vibrio sp. SS-MA-C1-2 TaxID=2908646 RepID=UPI001F36FAF8|nr:hypothetical protein [Vibrio sp. SS-MA-C1-2]UJF17142.1 hypothetical protein L0B53_04290 [Vibrio sp. SS-MA-C1-2]